LPTTLNGTRVRTLGESLDVDTLGTRANGSVKLPFGAGIGVTYAPDLRWTVALDGQYEPWSDFSGDFDFPGYPVGDASGFSDRLRAAAGVEFLPAGDDLLASYMARLAYRIGFYYDRLYISPIPGENVQAFAVTGGLGLPA